MTSNGEPPIEQRIIMELGCGRNPMDVSHPAIPFPIRLGAEENRDAILEASRSCTHKGKREYTDRFLFPSGYLTDLTKEEHLILVPWYGMVKCGLAHYFGLDNNPHIEYYWQDAEIDKLIHPDGKTKRRGTMPLGLEGKLPFLHMSFVHTDHSGELPFDDSFADFVFIRWQEGNLNYSEILRVMKEDSRFVLSPAITAFNETPKIQQYTKKELDQFIKDRQA